MVAPRNRKSSIRFQAEGQPNGAGIREVIGIPFIGHENEVVRPARDRQDKRTLRAKRGVGVCPNAGIAERLPWAQDIVGR